MSTARQHGSISAAEYLRGEQSATRKHEYVDGVVYAMVGATNVHNRIATNATVALGLQLRGRPCQVYNSDTKIRVRSSRGVRFYYPDVSVVCRPNPPDDTFHDEPVVVVEVLSASTRRIDETEKREAYLSIGTLSAYVLVESSHVAAVVFRRGEGGFGCEAYGELNAVIPLSEIGCRLGLAELYDRVEFPPSPVGEEGAEEFLPG
jgi:Uma2 family endonuclease